MQNTTTTHQIVNKMEKSFYFFLKGGKEMVRGLEHAAFGLIGLGRSMVELTDTTAMLLGFFAIGLVGFGAVAIPWALISRERNISDTSRSVYDAAQNPTLARLVGYLLLGASVVIAYSENSN